jgi:glycosyltransferase involved in cell wall biosynthesis
MENNPWVSFCISTFKRPELLQEQLTLLLRQEFPFFEIVVSDNDPEASARTVVEKIHDHRLRYFHNGNNLGMVQSFNLSITRANTDYVVMVTDDDPIETSFLKVANDLWKKFPSHSIYAGFIRRSSTAGDEEVIDKHNFISEILDTDKTPSILWSSCVMKKADVVKVGLMPDYGSPHLADHALIAMVGSISGAVIKNKMYSSLTSHNTNFSKKHIDVYLSGCVGFYNTLIDFGNRNPNIKNFVPVVIKHLGKWFIGSFFILKKYYSVKQPNPEMLQQVELFAKNILKLPFMKKFRFLFHAKQFFFIIKKRLHLLK